MSLMTNLNCLQNNLCLLATVSHCYSNEYRSAGGMPLHSIQSSRAQLHRCLANSQPNSWDINFLQPLESKSVLPLGIPQVEEMKKFIKGLLEDETKGELFRLEMIDTVERLGLGYHVEKEIKESIDSIVSNSGMQHMDQSLYASALRFRIFRKHGIKISLDVFDKFKDTNENFKTCLVNDIIGMLSLYEASYMGIQGEDTLDEAKNFTTKYLKEIQMGEVEPELAKLVEHALELPLHWRMDRPEARWYIDLYSSQKLISPTLLEFAKYDFNMIQNLYQQELIELTRWWKCLGLISDKLEFARDRLVESFLWGMGMAPEPGLSNSRKEVAKVIALISVINDVYDVYGFLDDLELFTNAIERWDTSTLDQLPDYMKVCFMGLLNSTNELVNRNLKEQEFNSLPYIKQAWIDLCRIYMEKAKLYDSRCSQTLAEYLSTAWTAVGSIAILIQGYLASNEVLTAETLNCLSRGFNLIRFPALIVRLAKDLANSKAEQERGDALKSVQCHMKETGATEEEAREFIRWLIGETWKNMNEHILGNSSIPQTFAGLAINHARASHFMHQDGDGHGSPTMKDKERAIALLINPIL